MTLGTYPDMALQTARQHHRQALELLAKGKDPALLQQTNPLGGTSMSRIITINAGILDF